MREAIGEIFIMIRIGLLLRRLLMPITIEFRIQRILSIISLAQKPQGRKLAQRSGNRGTATKVARTKVKHVGSLLTKS